MEPDIARAPPQGPDIMAVVVAVVEVTKALIVASMLVALVAEEPILFLIMRLVTTVRLLLVGTLL
jgi:hypothetical protein